MNLLYKILFFLTILTLPTLGMTLEVGIGKTEITPPLGTPSAGYASRNGEGMEGVHDPLLAIALFLDNGEQQIVFCSADHLGFTAEMVQQVIQKVQTHKALANCSIYIGSSHTHSGGGAYLDLPHIGQYLAGPFNQEIHDFYIQRTAEAILQAAQNRIEGKLGIGYGSIEGISHYRGTVPTNVTPQTDVTILKVTKSDGTPFAVLFNFPLHPTINKSENRLFSADFVGYARDHLQTLLGQEVQPLYFNGAQGDIVPHPSLEGDGFTSCELVGNLLAKTVANIWNETETSDTLHMITKHKPYHLVPQATPFGLLLPIKEYPTSMHLLILNQKHAFLTLPGELSTVYDKELKLFAKHIGLQHLSILGLTNDAHGYIIPPESWRQRSLESRLSFGGELYGEITLERAKALLEP